MCEKRKDGKMQKTTVKRDIIVETVGELNVKLAAEALIRIMRRNGELNSSIYEKTPETKSPNNNKE